MTKKGYTSFQSSQANKQNGAIGSHQYHMKLTLVPTASHDQKGHVTPCFSYLHIIHKMVPLMIQLKSYDSKGTNGITGLKKSFFTSF